MTPVGSPLADAWIMSVVKIPVAVPPSIALEQVPVFTVVVPRETVPWAMAYGMCAVASCPVATAVSVAIGVLPAATSRVSSLDMTVVVLVVVLTAPKALVVAVGRSPAPILALVKANVVPLNFAKPALGALPVTKAARFVPDAPFPHTTVNAVESKEHTPEVVGAAPAAAGGFHPAVALAALMSKMPLEPRVPVWLEIVKSAHPFRATPDPPL